MFSTILQTQQKATEQLKVKSLAQELELATFGIAQALTTEPALPISRIKLIQTNTLRTLDCSLVYLPSFIPHTLSGV